MGVLGCVYMHMCLHARVHLCVFVCAHVHVYGAPYCVCYTVSSHFVTFINDIVNTFSFSLNLPNATPWMGPQISALSPEGSPGLLCHTEPHCLHVCELQTSSALSRGLLVPLLNDIT